MAYRLSTEYLDNGHLKRFHENGLIVPFKPTGYGNVDLWVSGDSVSGSTWLDKSPNGRDMTLTGSPTVSKIGGRKVVNFGTGKYANVAGWLDRTGSYTLLALVRLNNVGGVINEIMSQDTSRMQFRFNESAKLQYEVQYAVGLEGTAVTTNIWIAAGVVFDSIAGELRLYKNGGRVTSMLHGGASGIASNFQIGAFTSEGAYYFDGSIAEAVVYSTALTDDNIAEIADSWSQGDDDLWDVPGTA